MFQKTQLRSGALLQFFPLPAFLHWQLHGVLFPSTREHPDPADLAIKLTVKELYVFNLDYRWVWKAVGTMHSFAKIVTIWFCPSTSIYTHQHINMYCVRKTGNREVNTLSCWVHKWEKSLLSIPCSFVFGFFFFLISAFLGSPQKGNFFLTK